MCAFVRACMHASLHACIHVRTHTHMHACDHTNACTHACLRACVLCLRVRVRMYAEMHLSRARAFSLSVALSLACALASLLRAFASSPLIAPFLPHGCVQAQQKQLREAGDDLKSSFSRDALIFFLTTALFPRCRSLCVWMRVCTLRICPCACRRRTAWMEWHRWNGTRGAERGHAGAHLARLLLVALAFAACCLGCGQGNMVFISPLGTGARAHGQTHAPGRSSGTSGTYRPRSRHMRSSCATRSASASVPRRAAILREGIPLIPIVSIDRIKKKKSSVQIA